LYIIADGFYYAGYSVINAFLSLLITSRITGGRIDIVGFVIGYYLFFRSIVEVPVARFTRTWSLHTRKNVVAASYVTYGAVVIAMGYAGSLAEIFLIQTVVAMFDAVAYPLKWTLFTKNLRREEELSWALEDISATLLPAIFTVLAGFLSQQFGIGAAFWLFGTLLIVSGGMFFFITPPRTD